MSVGSMSVLSIYSAQFQHHVRRLLRRARRRQRRRSQRKRSRRRRHRVHTTRGDPTEKPTENATGKVHVRTRQGGGRRAARSTKPRARAPACSLHYLVVGSPWRCPPCRLPLLRWRSLVPRQTKSAAHSTKRRLLLFLPPSYLHVVVFVAGSRTPAPPSLPSPVVPLCRPPLNQQPAPSAPRRAPASSFPSPTSLDVVVASRSSPRVVNPGSYFAPVACGLPPNQQPAPSARQHPREAPLPSPLLPDVVPRSASSFSSESGPRVVNPGSYFAPVTKISRRSQHQANSPCLVAWSPSFPPWHQERHQHQELPCWLVAPAASS